MVAINRGRDHRQLRNVVLIRCMENYVAILLGALFFLTLWMGETLHTEINVEERLVQSLAMQSASTIPKSNQTSAGAVLSLTSKEKPQQFLGGTNNLWDSNPNIPDWMKSYFDWHQQQLATLSAENWQNYKYLILHCYKSDERCGGVSDRLKVTPLLLLAAHRSQRLFFIDWDRPCRLEEFLVPPKGGFVWSIPEWLGTKVREKPIAIELTRALNVVNRSMYPDQLMFTHIQTPNGGAENYDAVLGDGAFYTVFHDLFRMSFQPTPPIQQIIDDHLSSAGLVLGEYSVAHFRASYGKELERHPVLSKPNFLIRAARNAIRCASELQSPPLNSDKKIPIFFASDNAIALNTVKEWAEEVNYPLIQFDRTEEVPLRLDYYGNETHPTKPSDYYSTFVDLFLAGSGKCVTHGRGGFGRLASLLSYNTSCVTKHINNFLPDKCKGISPFTEKEEEEAAKRKERNDGK